MAQRCLALTAAFEGHGYSIVVGNFDGAWLTWGIIGFTLKHGELRSIVLETWNRAPQIVTQALGEKTTELVDRFQRHDPTELARWADSISLDSSKVRVAEPWRTGFVQLGQSPVVQEIQIQHAVDDYFTPALRTAQAYGLASELGVALAFDIHVQNGGIKTTAAQAIADEISKNPPADERSRR